MRYSGTFQAPADPEEPVDNDPMQSTRGLSPLFLAIKRNAYDILFILLRNNCSVAVIGEFFHAYELKFINFIKT